MHALTVAVAQPPSISLAADIAALDVDAYLAGVCELAEDDPVKDALLKLYEVETGRRKRSLLRAEPRSFSGQPPESLSWAALRS